MPALTRRDWTLLVLACAGERSVSRLQLQKTLFVLGKWLPDAVGENFFHFEAYHYGPFAKAVYDEAEALVALQYALPAEKDFFATASGRTAAKALPVEPEARATLERIVGWATMRSFDALCEDVYQAFPDMRKRSVMPAPAAALNRPSSLVEWFERLPPEEHARVADVAGIARASAGDASLEQDLVVRAAKR